MTAVLRVRSFSKQVGSRKALLIVGFLLLTPSCDNLFHHSAPRDHKALKLVVKLNEAEAKFHKRFGRYGSLRELGLGGRDLITRRLPTKSMPVIDF